MIITFNLFKIESNCCINRTYNLLSVAWSRPSEDTRLGNARQGPEISLDDGGWGEIRNVFIKKLLDQVLEWTLHQTHDPVLYQ